MQREWDDREHGERQAAYRAHLREMTAARQAAERLRAMRRTGDAAGRRAAEQAFQQQIARIEEGHRAWLREHLPADDLPGERHAPHSRRVVPPE